MTTIRDYLKDFAKDLLEQTSKTLESEEEVVERLVDEYTGVIKERIVG